MLSWPLLCCKPTRGCVVQAGRHSPGPPAQPGPPLLSHSTGTRSHSHVTAQPLRTPPAARMCPAPQGSAALQPAATPLLEHIPSLGTAAAGHVQAAPGCPCTCCANPATEAGAGSLHCSRQRRVMWAAVLIPGICYEPSVYSQPHNLDAANSNWQQPCSSMQCAGTGPTLSRLSHLSRCPAWLWAGPSHAAVGTPPPRERAGPSAITSCSLF